MPEYINKQEILEKAKAQQGSPFGVPLIIAEIEKADTVEINYEIDYIPDEDIVVLVSGETKIKCIECKHHMFSDFYLECSKHLKIVNGDDTCEDAERKDE